MSLATTHAAEALYPTLSAFHAVQGHALQAVREISIEGSLERVVLHFGSIILTARANEDDDTIEISVMPSDRLTVEGQDVSNVRPWRDLIGRSFGWGWLTMNQQGYVDGASFGFDGIAPQVLLNVVASSIKISRIEGISPEM